VVPFFSRFHVLAPYYNWGLEACLTLYFSALQSLSGTSGIIMMMITSLLLGISVTPVLCCIVVHCICMRKCERIETCIFEGWLVCVIFYAVHMCYEVMNLGQPYMFKVSRIKSSHNHIYMSLENKSHSFICPFSCFILVYTFPLLLDALINLLVRKPLARLQILLLERRIQHAQTPYLACTRRIIALDVRFSFAVCGLESEGSRSLN
jgi:hypothetical protein